jgi:hypothetical protein
LHLAWILLLQDARTEVIFRIIFLCNKKRNYWVLFTLFSSSKINSINFDMSLISSLWSIFYYPLFFLFGPLVSWECVGNFHILMNFKIHSY